MINFLSLTLIPTKHLPVLFLLQHIQFLKFNSSINLSFFRSPCNELSTYIEDFNWYWSTKSSHLRAAFSTFCFISYKQISYLVFVGSVGDSYFSTFTFSFIISTRLLFLHLRIIISSYLIFIALLQYGWSAYEFELEVLLVALLVLVLLLKTQFFWRRIRFTLLILFPAFMYLFSFSISAALRFFIWSSMIASIKRYVSRK